MEALSNFFGGGMVLILSIVFRSFDAYDGLSGFSAMNAEEKKKWNIKAAGRFLCNSMIAGSLVLVVTGVLVASKILPPIFIMVSWLVWIIVTLLTVIYVNGSGKFKAEK